MVAKTSQYSNMACTRRMSTKISLINALKTNKINDNVYANAFEIQLNSSTAEVLYEKDGNIYNLIHSSIPEQYHGQGLGHVLAERVFDHLHSKKKRVKLSCEFLRRFYEQNSDKYDGFVIDE